MPMNLPPVKWRAVSIHREEFIHWPAPICRARNRRDALVRVVASCLVLASLVLSRCSSRFLPILEIVLDAQYPSLPFVSSFCSGLEEHSSHSLSFLATISGVSFLRLD